MYCAYRQAKPSRAIPGCEEPAAGFKGPPKYLVNASHQDSNRDALEAIRTEFRGDCNNAALPFILGRNARERFPVRLGNRPASSHPNDLWVFSQPAGTGERKGTERGGGGGKRENATHHHPHTPRPGARLLV